MPNWDDNRDSSSPGQAAAAAADAFPDSPPSAITSCSVASSSPAPSGAGGGTGGGGPAWTQAEIKSNLDTCDGGTNVWSKGKAGNSGKDPVIKEGSSVIGSGASVNHSTGVITIDPGKTKCEATQYSIQELSNLGHTADFDKIRGPDCKSRALSRDDFIRANEKLEYDGVKSVNDAFSACKAKWGCADSSTSVMDWAKGAKDFDDYYKSYLGQNHKDYYGKMWDTNCKAAWDKKNPASPPSSPPSKSPSPSGDNPNDDSASSDDGTTATDN